MRRRVSFVLAGAAVVLLAVANSLPASPAPGADWSRPHSITTPGGLTAAYPRAWEAFAHGESLVISSFRIPRDWPDREHKRVPAGGVYIVIWSYGSTWAGYPSGRRPFELRRAQRGFYGCSFGLDGYRILFTKDGQAMQAMIALGRGARAADALAVLDRL